MNKNNSLEIAITLRNPIPSAMLKAAGVATFVILTTIGAKVKIPLPFTPVPMTLQLFFVLLSGSILGRNLGALSQGIYLFLGLIGLPVLAGEKGGLQYLFGSTGGYLIGFIAAAYIVGILTSEKESKFRNIFFPLVGYGAGVILIYLLGCLWLSIWANMFNGLSWNIAAVLKKGALPFMAADVLKIFGAALALWMGRWLKNLK
jgi:biotin transport system substrate-specific component